MRNPLTREDWWEITLMALAAWREARGEPYDGKSAVCWVIMNRAAHGGWWGSDVEEVVLKPWQFSAFNQNDKNATRIPGDPSTDKEWAECLLAAERAWRGILPDHSKGATHYYAAYLDDRGQAPEWAAAPSTKFRVTIGGHKFYKAR